MTNNSSQSAPLNEYEDDSIDLFELWATLVTGWKIILLCTLIGSGAVVAYALTSPLIYRAELTAMPADEGGNKGAGLAAQFGGLADLAGVNVGGSASKAEALATLKSRSLIDEFIKQNELLPILFPKAWDAERKTWGADVKNPPSARSAYSLFAEKILSVNEDKKSGLITVGIEWTDRQLAAVWANELITRTNQLMRTRAIAEAQKNIDFLNQELRKTSVVEIQQTIYRLLETNLKTISVASAREQYAFKVIDPAVASDANKPIKPKKRVIAVAGTLAGLFLGIFIVMLLSWRKNYLAQRAINTQN